MDPGATFGMGEDAVSGAGAGTELTVAAVTDCGTGIGASLAAAEGGVTCLAAFVKANGVDSCLLTLDAEGPFLLYIFGSDVADFGAVAVGTA